jgi:uncharacterized protein
MSPIDLHEYARRNSLRELEEAIAKGRDVNERDAAGCTPLHCAIAEKSVEAAFFLLEHGADVTAQDNRGSTALHGAVAHRLPQVAEELLRRDAGLIGISDKYGNEPLWDAPFGARGDYILVALLLRHGADPGHRNRAGLSSLDLAKRMEDQSLLQVLLGKSAR